MVDPASPEGPRAIGMHVPANSLSKAWQLMEEGYAERIELLSGSAILVVNPAGTEEWTTIPLTKDDPTGRNTVVGHGDIFCIVTGEEDAFVLSRPSKPFDISFERGLTAHPSDDLSQLILSKTVVLE